MATFYVRKNGSGTHTSIQHAVYESVNGDTVDVGEGIWYENLELLGKMITLQGAGRDKTTIQGKATNDVFNGCSYFGGESVVTVPDTTGMVIGKSVSGLTSNARITAINGNQVSFSLATPTTGNVSASNCTWASGVSTITLPTTTAVVVGMKASAAGINSTVTAYNSTTRVVTLSSPTTAAGTSTTITFRRANTNISVTQINNPINNSYPGSIMVTGTGSGMVIKDLRAIGFDNSSIGQEAAALFFSVGTSPGISNFLIDNCWFTANGDSAIMSGSNAFLVDGTFQNCLIDGQTFVGSEPADVPGFSSYVSTATITSIGASSSVVTFSDMRGVILNRSFTSAGAFSGSASITAINGNQVTINKVITGTIGATINCSFSLTRYQIPNVARSLCYIGDNKYPNIGNTKNITFRNNTIKGRTGAVISATGNVQMFDSAVSIESHGGLVENNIFDGNFGAGPNALLSNYILRCRQANIVVQNNTNYVTGGRVNSGFLILYGTSTNNITIDRALVQSVPVTGQPKLSFTMEKGQLKSLSKVSSNTTFSSEANWNIIAYIFKHTSSSKRIATGFRGNFDNAKVYRRRANMQANEVYELQKIILADSSRQMLVVNRSELDNASSYDITLI